MSCPTILSYLYFCLMFCLFPWELWTNVLQDNSLSLTCFVIFSLPVVTRWPDQSMATNATSGVQQGACLETAANTSTSLRPKGLISNHGRRWCTISALCCCLTKPSLLPWLKKYWAYDSSYVGKVVCCNRNIVLALVRLLYLEKLIFKPMAWLWRDNYLRNLNH